VNVIDRHEPPRQIAREFARIYGEHFVNYSAVARYTGIDEQGGMLVITYDDFRPAMEPFVRWKNEMGMRTRMFDVSGIWMDAVEIKDFIRAHRDTVPDMVYVLFVGDAAQVPPMHASGNTSDPRYSLLDGDDDYPDILVGRFSAQTLAHAETQALRSMNYEKFPQPGAAWYRLGCGIGSSEGPGDDGEMDWEHIDNIRTDLLGYTYTAVDQIYDPGASASQVSAALNNGRGILNYCGHGSTTAWGTTGFSVTRVNALTNDHKLPFIFDVACLNGNFENYTCFAEAWLRAKNASTGNPTGAIGIYASSINQSWDPPMCAQDAMNDLLVQDEKRTFGGLCYCGSMQMMDEYYGDGATMFKTWHVFGDPSLRVRTDTPGTAVVVNEKQIPADATVYTVTVTGVEGALCGLSCGGEYVGSGITGPNGAATIAIEAALPDSGNVLLTVTGYNLVPVFDTLTVIERTDAAERSRSTLAGTSLGNFPNPFNPETTVSFSLATPSRVEIDVYSVSGAHVASLLDGDLPAGAHRVAWDGRDAKGHSLAAGVYLCRLKTGDEVLTHKMVMAK